MKTSVWVRCFFLLVLIQALSIGRSLIWPELIAFNLPWPASPLNARFVAALYCMGAASALLSVFARSYAAVRISAIEIGAITGGLLLITLPHLGEFTPETFPYRWLILYVADPLIAGLIVWRMHAPMLAGRNRLAPLFTAYAAVLAVVGIVLLLAPGWAAQLWPWSLPSILGQVYSIFFLTFALGGLLAARQPGWEGVWIYVAANLIMLVLIVGVSLYHADRFKAGPPTWAWFLVCCVAALAFAAALAGWPRRLLQQGAVS